MHMGKISLSYKDYHELKVGSARVNLQSVVAGKETSLILSYTVGEVGIADGGVLKILFPISTDVPDVQFEDKNAPNLVRLLCKKKGIELVGYSRNNGLKGKVHERPWTNGFIIFVKKGYLSKGDMISVEFHNWRMQTYVEETFEFRIVVDSFNTGRFV